MKLVRVRAIEDYLKVCNDSMLKQYTYVFARSGELFREHNGVFYEAWFTTTVDAVEALLEDGYDEADIVAMDFETFDYVPGVTHDLQYPAVIYDTGISMTSLGEDITAEICDPGIQIIQ
jgi:hypothetical protein